MKTELATSHGRDHERRPSDQTTMTSSPSPPSSTPPSSRQRLAFLGAFVLFAGWLAWLAWLSVTTQNPVVLSRPQFLVSALDVVIQLDRIPDGPHEVTVKRVLWAMSPEDRKLENASITITNLERTSGWTGPGEYLLPLIPDGPAGRFQVPATPRSPGFEPDPRTEVGKPRIYPATEKTLRQHQTLARPRLE